MTENPKKIPTTTSAWIWWSDLQNFVRHEISLKNQYIIDILKNYYMYTNDRTMELIKDDEERRSNLKSPLTNMFCSKVTNMVLGMDMRFVATDLKLKDRPEDEKRLATEMLDVMDSVWRQPVSHNAFKDAIGDAVLFWRGIYKIWYSYSTHTEKIIQKWWGTSDKLVTVSDTPVIHYVSPLNFFIAPWANHLQWARFIAERKLMHDDEILAEYGIFWLTIKAATRDWAENNTITNTDYESVKRNMPYYNSSIKRDITDDATYNIKKKIREVIEVSTPDWVTLYINWVKEWPRGQLWPNRWYRYKLIQFKKNQGTMFSLGLGVMMKPIQEAYDKIFNTRLDNVTLVWNKMFLYNDAFNISGNSRRLKLKPWMLHKVSDLDAIKELNTWEIKESQYAETDALFSMLQAFSWVSSNALWLQNKVERTAWGAETLENAGDDTVKPLVDSIIENVAETMREVMLLALYYMEDEQFDKILWKDNILKNMDMQILLDDFDFDFYMESQHHKKSAVERQQLMTFLQSIMQMTDAAGRPVANVRAIAEKLWDSYDMEWNPILWTEDFEADVEKGEIFKWDVQAKAQAAAQQGQTPPPAPSWVPTDWGNAELRNLQQLGWANIPPELSSNNKWIN